MLLDKGMDIDISLYLLIIIPIFFLSTVGCQAFYYESAYHKTAVDQVEVKLIPASKTLVTSGEGKYFDRDNQLFMRLFNYIKENDVAMTIPVEASIKKAGMVFYVGERDGDKNLKDMGTVKVIRKDSRLVVSVGIRGSYTEKNFLAGKKQLMKWLASQDEYKAAGDAYAVYWNGPFVPGFLKRSEVHIPVETTKTIEKTDDPDLSDGEAMSLITKKTGRIISDY